MNSINGLNFYDALTKFIIGFLITFLWLPQMLNCAESCCTINLFLYSIFCFIAGFIWQMFYDICGKLWKVFLCVSDCFLGKFSDCFRSITGKSSYYCKCKCGCTCFFCDLIRFIFCDTRNNVVWIKKAKIKVMKERIERCRKSPTNHKYYKAYYENVNDPIGSVKTLEAHEAFLRYMIFLLPLISPIALMVRRVFHLKINCANFLPDLSHCVKMTYVFIGCLLMDLILFYVWRKIQFKIHELVWEANYYKEEINLNPKVS